MRQVLLQPEILQVRRLLLCVASFVRARVFVVVNLEYERRHVRQVPPRLSSHPFDDRRHTKTSIDPEDHIDKIFSDKYRYPDG